MKRSDFENLREILERSPAMKRIREHFRQGQVLEAWNDVVGPTLARKTRARRYRGGKLFVDVFSAPLLQELATYRKRGLLGKLKKTKGFEGIIDIVFRHG